MSGNVLASKIEQLKSYEGRKFTGGNHGHDEFAAKKIKGVVIFIVHHKIMLMIFVDLIFDQLSFTFEEEQMDSGCVDILLDRIMESIHNTPGQHIGSKILRFFTTQVNQLITGLTRKMSSGSMDATNLIRSRYLICPQMVSPCQRISTSRTLPSGCNQNRMELQELIMRSWL
jgi:hypothetical protein